MGCSQFARCKEATKGKFPVLVFFEDRGPRQRVDYTHCEWWYRKCRGAEHLKRIERPKKMAFSISHFEFPDRPFSQRGKKITEIKWLVPPQEFMRGRVAAGNLRGAASRPNLLTGTMEQPGKDDDSGGGVMMLEGSEATVEVTHEARPTIAAEIPEGMTPRGVVDAAKAGQGGV